MHILVMDDEPYIREVTSEMLNFLGHRVSVTASGENAVEAYVAAAGSGDPFDLVILDVTVPGAMGGQETIIELRRIDPDVRAIVTSGYSSDPLLADFAEHGFAGRLEKPFSLERLKQTIDDILNRN